MSSVRTYNSIVLVKQVPDTHNITGQAMKEDGTVNRAALPAIFNPEDLNALDNVAEAGRRAQLRSGQRAAECRAVWHDSRKPRQRHPPDVRRHSGD